MTAFQAIRAMVLGAPKVGEPIWLEDSGWALVESIKNEFHDGYDEFVDIYTLRWADGHQTRHTSRELFPPL